ncbi:unnamed protein product [Clavelina lepadiformis]|uniref:Uncharacterized protein n=1 Tax=Clavelina lepadiformis TaxID=159417 RepID=A0ABP0FKC7_CLALP
MAMTYSNFYFIFWSRQMSFYENPLTEQLTTPVTRWLARVLGVLILLSMLLFAIPLCSIISYARVDAFCLAVKAEFLKAIVHGLTGFLFFIFHVLTTTLFALPIYKSRSIVSFSNSGYSSKTMLTVKRFFVVSSLSAMLNALALVSIYLPSDTLIQDIWTYATLFTGFFLTQLGNLDWRERLVPWWKVLSRAKTT